jgi:hypothetical protein
VCCCMFYLWVFVAVLFGRAFTGWVVGGAAIVRCH